MKNQSISILAIIFLATSLFTSCGKGDHSAEMHESSEEPEVTEAAIPVATVSASASPIMDAYYKVKDALVATDTEAAAASAATLVEAIADKNEAILSSATIIASSTDAATQREEFEKLSMAIYDWVKAEKPGEATIYKQFCPMAFSGKGAYWLSSNKEIMNPYYGDKMLHCGSVREEI